MGAFVNRRASEFTWVHDMIHHLGWHWIDVPVLELEISLNDIDAVNPKDFEFTTDKILKTHSPYYGSCYQLQNAKCIEIT